MSVRNLVATLNGHWQLRLTLVAEGQLFATALEPLSHSTEVSHMQTLHALERNCTMHHYSNSKSTLWDWTVFHSQYVSDRHVVTTGETRNVYWILEGTFSGDRRWLPPLPSAEVKERVGLYLPFWVFVACCRVNCTFTFYSMNMWEVVQDCIRWW